MQGIIKVSPQLLVNTATEFGTQGTNISNLTTSMMDLVVGLAGSWEGEAANTFITKFRGLEDDIQRMIGMVQEHTNDLEEMAQNYQNADEVNASDASGLSDNVIV